MALTGGVIGTVDIQAFRKAMLSQEMSVWQGPHMSPWVAPTPMPSCAPTFPWFARPDRVHVVVEPYDDLPMFITKL